jgi:uncharacterized protein (DUF58 family)
MRNKQLKHTQLKTERRVNARLLPVFVGVLAVLYGLTGYRGWLVFLIGMAGVWLLAALWIHSLERGLSIERKIHLAWATVGDSVPEELNVINTSRLPALWVEIVDEADRLETPLRLVSDVAPQTTRRRHPVHLFNRRGFYTLGPTRLRTGDPFGIYSLTLHDRHSSSILVTPPHLPLTQLRLAPGGWSGDRRRQRGALEREISDAGVRNYVAGDSLRRIHWRASAHKDALIVRQLEADSSLDWWVFVDLEAAVQAGTGQDSTLELSIVLAASLVMRGMKEHRRVGLAMVGPKFVWLEPRSDPAHRWRIMQALAMAEAGDRSLAALISLGGPLQTAAKIFITPSTDLAWVAVAGRNHHGNNMLTLLVDPAEFGSSANQTALASTLARSSVPFRRMPRSLLEQAYAPLIRGTQAPLVGVESGKRYVQSERTTWQHMD